MSMDFDLLTNTTLLNGDPTCIASSPLLNLLSVIELLVNENIIKLDNGYGNEENTDPITGTYNLTYPPELLFKIRSKDDTIPISLDTNRIREEIYNGPHTYNFATNKPSIARCNSVVWNIIGSCAESDNFDDDNDCCQYLHPTTIPSNLQSEPTTGTENYQARSERLVPETTIPYGRDDICKYNHVNECVNYVPTMIQKNRQIDPRNVLR